MSLADSLESAATELSGDADAIRPANGDPFQLLEQLDETAASRVLSWLLANEPDAGVELALAWADEGADEADEQGAEESGAVGSAESIVRIFQGVDEAGLPKVGKKGLRKALHRLRSRGLEVPKRESGGQRVARLPEIEGEIAEGYLSALDPRGGRLVYILEANPAGGARLFELLLDDDRGIIDFQVYGAARGRIRSFLKQALDRSRFPTVEVPLPALRALIARIESLHPTNRVLPQAFVEHRGRLSVAGEAPGDLVARALGADPAKHDEALALSAELVRKGTVGPWGPVAEVLAARVDGELELAGARPEGEEDWPSIAERVFCDEATNEATRQRLRESAYVLWKMAQEEEARACLAGAKAFEELGAAGNLLATAMTETLLAPAVAAIRSRAAEPGDHPAEPETEE